MDLKYKFIYYYFEPVNFFFYKNGDRESQICYQLMIILYMDIYVHWKHKLNDKHQHNTKFNKRNIIYISQDILNKIKNHTKNSTDQCRILRN